LTRILSGGMAKMIQRIQGKAPKHAKEDF
jgi:hypothetical protein